MDIQSLATNKAPETKRSYDRYVKVTHVAPESEATIASRLIASMMRDGHALSCPISGRKGDLMDLTTLTQNTAPVEIGAGRGRKAAEVSFSEDVDLDAFVEDAQILEWISQNTLRFTLDADSVGFKVDGKVKNPAGVASRYLREYFAELHDYKVSAVPRGTTKVDFKVRGIIVEDTDSE